ncbi:MAG: hypothetical protein ACKPKO_28480, partial [Candidatus Fonsibacter sp.]
CFATPKPAHVGLLSLMTTTVYFLSLTPTYIIPPAAQSTCCADSAPPEQGGFKPNLMHCRRSVRNDG